MSAAHTPGPWSCSEWDTTGPSAAAAFVGEAEMNDYGHAHCRVAQAQGAGQNAVAVAVGDSQIEADANAARIVACVNACEGLDDPARSITEMRMVADEAYVGIAHDLESLRAQRDELAAALDEYVRVVQEVGCTEEWRKARLEQMAERDRAALAKVRP